MRPRINRRRVLRGLFGGGVVGVGLPFLDCFLDENGTALADGAPLPVCFGTWMQELGLNPGFWAPKTVGPHYENNVQLKVLDPFRDRINIFSGMKCFLDGKPLQTHVSGVQVGTTGTIPLGTDSAPSIDSLIADTIGKRTRFRSLEVALDGSAMSASKRSGSSINPSEGSPLALYERIFGPEFKDPNAADFTPDTGVMARRSVLSHITEERQNILKQVGTADRARLDEYFTALRDIEQQLDLELQKPAPLAACTIPAKPAEGDKGTVVDDAGKNNALFAALLTHAIACDQTRVINVRVNSAGLRKKGSSRTWHICTHEEPVDEKLGYQLDTTWFADWATSAFGDFLRALDSVREGPGTVLDRIAVLWQTDHSYARTHTIDNMPIMTAGRAGGRIKTGIHVAAPGDPVTRVGLTLQQALGVPTDSWGALSNRTAKTITEILA